MWVGCGRFRSPPLPNINGGASGGGRGCAPPEPRKSLTPCFFTSGLQALGSWSLPGSAFPSDARSPMELAGFGARTVGFERISPRPSPTGLAFAIRKYPIRWFLQKQVQSPSKSKNPKCIHLSVCIINFRMRSFETGSDFSDLVRDIWKCRFDFL